MALINQLLSSSYPLVLAERKKAANQWEESAFLNEMDRQGAIERKSLGPTIDVPLDYQRNPDAAFLTTDLQATTITATEVITTAQFTPAQLYSPITWSKMTEATNPSDNQKIDIVTGLIKNGMKTHDDLIEQAFFALSTQGFLGLLTHMPTNGQSSDGTIDSTTYAFWRNQNATYVDDTDIEASFTTVWNACAKGSGSDLVPTWMVSDGTTQGIFEGTQQALQRWEDQTLKAGFKTLMFKTARYVFSQYGTTSVFFGNPKSFKLIVSREYFRELEDTQVIQNANGFTRKIYSALQTVTDNRSRLGVAHV